MRNGTFSINPYLEEDTEWKHLEEDPCPDGQRALPRLDQRLSRLGVGRVVEGQVVGRDDSVEDNLGLLQLHLNLLAKEHLPQLFDLAGSKKFYITPQASKRPNTCQGLKVSYLTLDVEVEPPPLAAVLQHHGFVGLLRHKERGRLQPRELEPVHMPLN